ncbi:unnamed protein product [Haemonchus placei]|uniref:Ovule protein n=1 Tax=Haemonchus placei TaxID=6290 RepID=A0A0N4X124_HAEPC|nr:unnamed protein product [Haemonchus placei]
MNRKQESNGFNSLFEKGKCRQIHLLLLLYSNYLIGGETFSTLRFQLLLQITCRRTNVSSTFSVTYRNDVQGREL